MRRPDGRLLLEVIGREKVILRAAEIPVIAPALEKGAVQKIAVAQRQGRFPFRGQGYSFTVSNVNVFKKRCARSVLG